MHGGVKFYRGSAAAARSYVEADRSRADDYYLAEGTGLAERYVATTLPAVGDAVFPQFSTGGRWTAASAPFGSSSRTWRPPPSRSPQRDAEYGQAVLIVTGRDRTNRPNDQHPWQLLAGTSSELVARMLHVTWKEALERASDLRFL